MLLLNSYRSELDSFVRNVLGTLACIKVLLIHILVSKCYNFGGLANSRGSWVVGRMSWVVGKKSWVVGKKSWVVGKKSWVVGKKSWVVGKKSWVPRKKSWVLRKKSWVPNKKSLVPRKSRGFQAKCFRIFTFSLLECVFFVF